MSRAPFSPQPAPWYHPTREPGRAIALDLLVPALFAGFMAAAAAALVVAGSMSYLIDQEHWLVYAAGGLAFVLGGATGAYQTGKLLLLRG